MTVLEKPFWVRMGGASGGGKKVEQRNFVRVQWLAVLLPTLAIGLFEFLRHQLLAHALPGWLGTGWLGNVIGTLVVAAVVFGFVRFFTSTLGDLAAEAARAREAAAVVLERQRIAREMHDGVAQALFYLSVKLREVDGLMAAGAGGSAREELKMMEEEVRDANRQVRAMIADLKEQAGAEDIGFAIQRTVAELAERLEVRVSCELDGHATVSAFSRQHLLAIIHEALTNAHRHGRARSAAVRLKTDGEELEVEVSDDGAGFDPGEVPDEGHFGLAIMEERAQMAGGELCLESAPGLGTRVTVRLPEVAS